MDQKAYMMSKSYKWLTICSAAFLLVAFAISLIVDRSETDLLADIGVAVVMIGAIVGILWVVRYRLVLTEDWIEQQGVFGRRIYFDDVTFFMAKKKFGVVRSGLKSIRISKDIVGQEEILRFIAKRLKKRQDVVFSGKDWTGALSDD